LELHGLYDFLDWRAMGETTAVRLITSWATPAEAVDSFLDDLKLCGA